MILILAQSFPPDTGGIQAATGALAEEIGRTGEAVLVLADRVRGGGDPSLPAGAPYALRRFGGPKPLRRRWKAWVARRLIARGGVTGIIADSWKSLEFLPRPGVPAVVLAHGMEYPARPTPAKTGRIRRSLAGATAVSANSAYTASRVRAALGGEGPPVHVVNPAIPPQLEPSDAARAEAARIIGGGAPVLVTLARLEPRKGVDAVIRCLPVLAARHPGLTHVVIGDGPDAPRLRALADEVGVTARLRFPGRVSEDLKTALLTASDVFAMPARREGDSVEGYGVVYLEAGWFGVPSVAGREGGAADAVRDGETGLLCDGADPASVEAALGLLLDDAPLRARLGAAAREAARSGGWHVVAARLLTLMGRTTPR